MARPDRAIIGTILAALLLLGALAAYVIETQPARLGLSAATYEQLAGWRDDAVAAAMPALLRSCAAILAHPDNEPAAPRTKSFDFGAVADWRAPCAAAAELPQGDTAAVRQFLQREFVPLLADNNGESEGLFTGYFEVTLGGSRQRMGPYQTPLYRRPPDPLRTHYTRHEIDGGALAGKGLELLWVSDPVAAFFLEIQGSGLIRLAQGGTVRVGYDGSNAKPYVPVGRLLLERGIMPREKITMAAIRDWMEAHPKEGAELREENPSYVFFHELDGPGPRGAERVVLTPGRSLAVDRAFLPLGVPLWLDATQRFQDGSIRRLVVAQDTGGAIKGPVRGDLFWGHGKEATDGAGAMNARGRYYLLLPKGVAARLPLTGEELPQIGD